LPAVTGGSQGAPGTNVVLLPGSYSAALFLNAAHCWFLSGGVYNFQSGLTNTGDLISNELKPPDEPTSSNNVVRSTSQFWDLDSAHCAGGFDLQKVLGTFDLPLGVWSFVVTSVRSDAYNGVSYQRESAPSMCRQISITNHFDDVALTVSNVPGATSYNIYAALPGVGCGGPFGLAANLPVTGSVLNNNTFPCPVFTGTGCSLGNETMDLEAQLEPPFAPNALASPGTIGAYPPDSETAPLALSMPNQNPPSGAASRGDRANENNCETVGGAYATCPAAITPGAVELYIPAGGCFTTSGLGDTYVFSGYQFDWLSFYEPGPGSPPPNSCSNTFGGASSSGYIGLVYAASAKISIVSPFAFEVPGMGGIIADSFALGGTMPAITYNASYAPVPPATRLTS
jgi:hypothetical protein